MKLIIAGSREGFTYDDVVSAITDFSEHLNTVTEIVSGTARGVDRMGEQFANETNIPIKRFPADWETKGKSAGAIRNRQMGDYADALLALWDGKSSGTRHMINYMRSLNKPVYIYGGRI